ncbi:hypothetical protein [Tritonibacter scottomollicae]|uniref:Uncharacterized protein n=1 Tax=Tritonibacter scottomollicae TaxID=483013 RepID=A0A2T1A8Z2_TRISK|nr:hypothetical protein [Tritonibacter scottomollicae]PRZ45051.1 hypothetical protein CLV89_11856 [Tritonibacter scottomollicae]
MLFKSFTLSMAVALAAMSSAAVAQTYDCTFNDGHRRNVIPSQVIVELAADGQSAQVIDSVSHHHKIAPVAAKFVKNTNKRLRVRWSLKDVISSSGQKATLNFSLTHQKGNGKAFLNMDIPGYGNTESGNGRCALRK